MVPKASRWVVEMEQIAKRFQACGLTPRTFQGAAEIYALVAETGLGRTSPEQWRRRHRILRGGREQAQARPLIRVGLFEFLRPGNYGLALAAVADELASAYGWSG